MKLINLILITLISFSAYSCSKDSSTPDPEIPGQGGEEKPVDQNSGTIVVMSYNTRHSAPYYGTSGDTQANEQGIADVIKSKSAHIVCLQEIDSCNSRTSYVDQAKKIAQLAGYPYYSFFSIMDYRGGKYGLATLSNKQMTDVTTLKMPKEYNGTAITSNTSAGCVTIKVDGKNVRVINVHLSLYENERNAQLQYLYDKVIKTTTMPTLICGDFNGVRNSSTFNLILSLGFTPSNLDPTNYTIPSTGPNREIDYITYAPEDSWEVKSHMVITGTNASDHLPIVSVLKLKTK